MNLNRQPGDHHLWGEDDAPHDYLIVEQALFNANDMPEDEARFHLQLCGKIFSEQPRHTDIAYWSGIDSACYQVLVQLFEQMVASLRSCEYRTEHWNKQLRLCQRFGLLLLSLLYDGHSWDVGDPPAARELSRLMFPGDL